MCPTSKTLIIGSIVVVAIALVAVYAATAVATASAASAADKPAITAVRYLGAPPPPKMYPQPAYGTHFAELIG